MAHGVDSLQRDAIVSLCDRHERSVLIQFNTEPVQGSIIDYLKLLALGLVFGEQK